MDALMQLSQLSKPAKPGQYPGYAFGGIVNGPGGPRDDKVLARVKKESYVLPAETVKSIGRDNAQKLSAAEQLMGFRQEMGQAMQGPGMDDSAMHESAEGEASDDMMDVRLSNGEAVVPPESLQALGAAVLRLMHVTTSPPNQKRGEPPGYARGDLVKEEHKQNSFGDAAAVMANPGMSPVKPASAPLNTFNSLDDTKQAMAGMAAASRAQMAMSPASSPAIGSAAANEIPTSSAEQKLAAMPSGPIQRSAAQVPQPTGPAAILAGPTPQEQFRRSEIQAQNAPQSPMSAPTMQPSAMSEPTAVEKLSTINFDRATNTYSGTNVGPNATIVNGLNRGAYTGSANPASGEPGNSALSTLAQMPQVQAPSTFTPQVATSANDWGERNALRSLAVSANSLANDPSRSWATKDPRTGMTPAFQALMGGLQSDAQGRAANNALTQSAFQQQGNLAQAAMHEQGQNARMVPKTMMESAQLGLATQQAKDAMATSAVQRDKLSAEAGRSAQEARFAAILADPNTPPGQRQMVTNAMALLHGKVPESQVGKPLPSTAATALLSNHANMKRADKALRLLNGENVGPAVGDSKATSPWNALVPGAALQLVDPKGVDTRAAIADLGSLIIHDRSGAAVTAAEYPRLQPFIPSANDSPDVAKKKVQNFYANYSELVNDTRDFYKAQGYQVPELQGATDAQKKQPSSADWEKQWGAMPSGTQYTAPDGSIRRKK